MSAALDPQKSVVVEACAGSGKTWLLASRLIRLLLAGVAPSRILAITFTRRAAAEIEARLAEWLRYLACEPDEKVRAFLEERGLSDEQAHDALPRARGLFEKVVLADQPATITTFHGWFVRLIGAAPLNSGLSGLVLADAAQPLLEEAWMRLARRCGKAPDSPLSQAFVELCRDPGWNNARTLLSNFITRRAEWLAMGRDARQAAEALRELLGVSPAMDAFEQFFMRPGLIDDFVELAGLLIDNQAMIDAPLAHDVHAAREVGNVAALRAACLAMVLTKDKTPRSRKPSGAMEKRLGAARAERLIVLHQQLSSQVETLIFDLQEEAAYRLNRAVFLVGDALAEELESYKAARRLMDFGDLERHADALLGGEDAAFLQARLDARYEHILLDEFQDTNPLQWRILRSWFDAYGPGQERPKVFMVGDPKQSIYRFRRAEPRIFGAAADYLREHFGAHSEYNAMTRRNAPAVVEVVNQLFGAEPAFTGFRPQTAYQETLPGRVEVMPLIPRSDKPKPEGDGVLRDPLTLPREIADDIQRDTEAARLAECISQWVGRLVIGSGDNKRVARHDDFMLLCRKRKHLAHYEAALRAANIPYFSGSRGGLLDTLEAHDLAALLGFLASPADDLKLAHTLRSPLFAVSDEDLFALSRSGEGHWWQRLGAMVAAGAASAGLERAHPLLARWHELSAHLPVHDVLAAVFDEADVLARYRAVTHELMWPAVHANLEAFLRLSLELDGGRYPSLSRFNDELKRLRAARDEAPDEGVIDGAEHAGRVRILTIHAAKGLEAPLVWLIDAHGAGETGDAFDVLLDWPPDAHVSQHFSVFGSSATRGRRREHLFAQEQAAALREDLNLLYVAITRAQQFFVVSGIEPGKRSSAPTFYSRLRAAVEALAGENGAAHGAAFEFAGEGAAIVSSAGPTQPRLPKLAVGRRRDEPSRNQRYGTALHLALECLTENRPLPPGLDEAAIEHARRIIDEPQLHRFFDPAQCVRADNEVEFALPDGSIGRIDRLVEATDALWVLDYKAGRASDAPLEAYRGQLQRYRQVVKQLRPGRIVKCALIFGDGHFQEV